MIDQHQNASLNILLADDDIDDCFFFGKALKELPLATHLKIMGDGEQLMAYLSQNSENLPDVLFLDLSMPRKTGFECLQEIFEDQKLKTIPIVVFTISYPHNPDFEKEIINTLSGMGARHYIRKSTDFTKLKQDIYNALILLPATKLSA